MASKKYLNEPNVKLIRRIYKEVGREFALACYLYTAHREFMGGS